MKKTWTGSIMQQLDNLKYFFKKLVKSAKLSKFLKATIALFVSDALHVWTIIAHGLIIVLGTIIKNTSYSF